jgi:hypothetical protein
MVGTEFESRIHDMKSIKKDERAVKEFKIIFESNEPVQTFLETWDTEFPEYEDSIRHPFKSDKISWNDITYNIIITNLDIKFDALELEGVDLVKLKVKRTEKMDDEIFKYELIFHKKHEAENDLMISTVYLKRKEINPETDKPAFVLYKTKIERVFH